MATQSCDLCKRVVQVVADGRGFPPALAKRRLVKMCQDNGCRCKPVYTATVLLGPPTQGMADGS